MATSLLYVDGTKRLEVIDNFITPSIVQINTGLPGLQGKDGPPGPPGPRGPRGRPALPSPKVIFTSENIGITANTHNLKLPENASLIRLSSTNNYSITGASPVINNEMKLFMNTSPYTISFISNSSDSSIGNRFLFPTIHIKQYQNVSLLYDELVGGWLLLYTTETPNDIDGGTSSSS